MQIPQAKTGMPGMPGNTPRRGFPVENYHPALAEPSEFDCRRESGRPPADDHDIGMFSSHLPALFWPGPGAVAGAPSSWMLSSFAAGMPLASASSAVICAEQ